MSETQKKLEALCAERMEAMGLKSDRRYVKRLRWELEEVNAKDKSGYFWNLYEKKTRYPKNQNNLLIPKLLGIVGDYDISVEPTCDYGEFPDIDIDYISVVRDYLKTDWAPRTFGESFVSNIGNYTTFGLKSALIDMARVHGESRDEIQALTKNLDAKDDEGKALTWDAAMKLYPELKKYCEEHKDVADAAKRLLNRNRGMGVHAGGLIISSIPLSDLVPLVKRKDSPQASAWVEGLHGQDLGPVGLVKFDLLVISNLVQIAHACRLIKERKGLKGICNLPDQPDWTDVKAWRNDPVALAMADRGDLKCIFQFDKDSVRNMARDGGVTRFEDLVAYTSLNRPGCLGLKMDQRYIERKRGREEYHLHPLLRPILDKSYGVLVYQEDIMKILNVVGEIPLRDCELVRKAISKKKVEGFIKYKEMFVKNGMKNLGVSQKEINNLWDQVEAFAEYGFNKSMTIGTKITSVYSEGVCENKSIEEFVPGDVVLCVNEAGETVETEVVALHDHGVLPGYEVTFDDGYKVTCTLDHKFLTENGQKSLREIIGINSPILCDPSHKQESFDAEKERHRLDGPVWSRSAHEEGNVVAQQRVCGVPGEIVCNRGVDGSLRTEVQNQNFSASAPARMSRVSETGVEVGRSGRASNSDAERRSVWGGVGYLPADGVASAGLPKLRGDQAEEYKQKKYESESIRHPEKSVVGYCKENVCSTRNSESSGGKASSMAGGQPGEICEVYRGSMEISEAVEDGDMVAVATAGLGDVSHPVRRGSKASGLSERHDMDRSRRVLSLQRISAQRGEETSTGGSTETGCHAERGGKAAWQCDVDSSEYGVFCEFNGSYEAGMVGLAAGHAPVADTGRLVCRRILRVVPVGERQMYDLEVANPTHNFLLPNGVVTSNSHAVAYSYISARLLYLKAHYPHEFYTAILAAETLSEKIKDYKMEAKIHGVETMPLDINKSKITFDLVGDVIYYGFSNVKGIGEEPAKRIVAGQPYAGFEDFLLRFGTDANTLKPLVGLRVFKEADPVTLWKFVEHFKDKQKKIEDRKKRFSAGVERYQIQYQELTGRTDGFADHPGDDPFAAPEWKKKYNHDEEILADREAECGPDEGGEARWVTETTPIEGTDDVIETDKLKYFKTVKVKKTYNRWKELKKLWGRYQAAIRKADQNKEARLPTLAGFDASSWDIDDELVKELRDQAACETKFYGFQWESNLEKSPDFKGGMSFDQFRSDPDLVAAPVEVEIRKVSKRETKKKTGFYWNLEVEDAAGEVGSVNVWEDDWERFSKDLKKGNLVRMKVRPPSGGFKTYTFDGPPKHLRWKLPKSKDEDFRCVVMRPGLKVVEPDMMTHEEALEQFSDCTVEE